jgi:dienelactone hydrolase
VITRETLRKLLGPAPREVPLESETVDRVRSDGFERRRVQYAVEAGERVCSYLLIPERPTGAAVYCHHQHGSNFALGKSEVVGLAGDPDQALGPELARMGFVVIAPDAIAFEERNWSHPTGRAEYIELVTRLVRGETLLAKVLHDVSVGINYLSSLSEVDRRRIGFIGHSYGGRMALWAAAMDDRIRAAVSNCGCVDYEESLDREVGIQAEFCVPGILEHGDLEDIIRLIAPRALYISAAADDKYSRGAMRLFERTRDTFPAGQLQCRLWPGDHGFTAEMRSAAYQFLAEKLE